jgi:hypothetical protein
MKGRWYATPSGKGLLIKTDPPSLTLITATTLNPLLNQVIRTQHIYTSSNMEVPITKEEREQLAKEAHQELVEDGELEDIRMKAEAAVKVEMDNEKTEAEALRTSEDIPELGHADLNSDPIVQDGEPGVDEGYESDSGGEDGEAKGDMRVDDTGSGDLSEGVAEASASATDVLDVDPISDDLESFDDVPVSTPPISRTNSLDYEPLDYSTGSGASTPLEPIDEGFEEGESLLNPDVTPEGSADDIDDDIDDEPIIDSLDDKLFTTSIIPERQKRRRR